MRVSSTILILAPPTAVLALSTPDLRAICHLSFDHIRPAWHRYTLSAVARIRNGAQLTARTPAALHTLHRDVADLRLLGLRSEYRN